MPPLFADECCPAPLVRALRAKGFDVAYVIEGDVGLTDEAQAREAFRQGRIVVSSDYDFGELAIRHGEPFVGLVLLAPDLDVDDASAAPEIARRIAVLGDTLVGNLTNLARTSVRQRRL